jgi:spore coat polysaccharide biosynthesis protein SpsF (cytidylyltransferase family)
MRILGIIQARMGSSRLPNKVLLDLAGKTVIEHVVARALRAEYLENVIVATSIDKNNLPLIKLCADKNISVFVGSEDDVLDRFYQAAKLFNPEHIARITADCPVLDPGVVDKVLSTHLNSGADYTSNTLIPSYPDGLDISVFPFSALEESWKKATLSSEREHVTPYLRKHQDIFVHKNVLNDVDDSDRRWTLDEPKDYDFLTALFNGLFPVNDCFGYQDILDYLQLYPELETINSGISRNEGYIKSTENDHVAK